MQGSNATSAKCHLPTTSYPGFNLPIPSSVSGESLELLVLPEHNLSLGPIFLVLESTMGGPVTSYTSWET